METSGRKYQRIPSEVTSKWVTDSNGRFQRAHTGHGGGPPPSSSSSSVVSLSSDTSTKKKKKEKKHKHKHKHKEQEPLPPYQQTPPHSPTNTSPLKSRFQPAYESASPFQASHYLPGAAYVRGSGGTGVTGYHNYPHESGYASSGSVHSRVSQRSNRSVDYGSSYYPDLNEQRQPSQPHYQQTLQRYEYVDQARDGGDYYEQDLNRRQAVGGNQQYVDADAGYVEGDPYDQQDPVYVDERTGEVWEGGGTTTVWASGKKAAGRAPTGGQGSFPPWRGGGGGGGSFGPTTPQKKLQPQKIGQRVVDDKRKKASTTPAGPAGAAWKLKVLSFFLMLPPAILLKIPPAALKAIFGFLDPDHVVPVPPFLRLPIDPPGSPGSAMGKLGRGATGRGGGTRPADHRPGYPSAKPPPPTPAKKGKKKGGATSTAMMIGGAAAALIGLIVVFWVLSGIWTFMYTNIFGGTYTLDCKKKDPTDCRSESCMYDGNKKKCYLPYAEDFLSQGKFSTKFNALIVGSAKSDAYTCANNVLHHAGSRESLSARKSTYQRATAAKFNIFGAPSMDLQDDEAPTHCLHDLLDGVKLNTQMEDHACDEWDLHNANAIDKSIFVIGASEVVSSGMFSWLWGGGGTIDQEGIAEMVETAQDGLSVGRSSPPVYLINGEGHKKGTVEGIKEAVIDALPSGRAKIVDVYDCSKLSALDASRILYATVGNSRGARGGEEEDGTSKKRKKRKS
eukprot:TRINITY_DN65751_c1_g3_i1.p1 TRINITY_DN65751_c1_g3~~TRINITY_DN65751_c1_g3_i1.p1  ORF type:complete len:834 (-),score=96.90 TRINITY_DN65751_c1_g3_i1:1944-4133(-)